ncbi:MAG TPA: cupin domain-containing protein [Solirubrobacteraceae bacterium]|nr:cupin domain-containing protein [Solirubrobacteraceae bacterium]
MARAGDILENAATGERIVFEETAAESGGERLRFEMLFTPQGFVAQEHLHPAQQELHEVISGRLGVVIGGAERVLGPGDSLLVPAGTPHRLVEYGQVQARFELRPALRQEVLLETFMGLARDGRIGRRGMPSLLQLAVIGREFAAEGHATKPPLPVQRALFGPLAAIGRRRGYRGAYEAYSGPAAAAPVAREPGYVFVDEWDVAAPIDAVFDALADSRGYPEWWKPVYIDVEADGPPAVGAVARQHFKGRLPYHLRTRAEVVRLERPTTIEGIVDGDLSGRGLWTLSERDGVTHVRFDWRVNADRALLRVLTPVLRPLFRWNHNWAIARAVEGLEPYAQRLARRGRVPA